MRNRSYGSTLAWLAATVAAFCAGYALRDLITGLQRHAAPIVHTDVRSDELVRLGFAFGRPPDATQVAVAIVGNGVGDSSVYASFDLPESRASDFIGTLKSQRGFEPYTFPVEVHYLEQLPGEVSAMLWPQTGFTDAEVLLGDKVLVAWRAGSQRIHAFKP